MASLNTSRLKSQLLTSGLQQKDSALFQVINSLIGAINSLNGDVDNFSGGIGATGPAGADGATGAVGPMIPYFIASDEILIIPEFKQGLFTVNIDNEGIIDIEGLLVEVD